jgi:transcriptional repressor NrdR
MRCPFCKENRDKVIDSRESADGFVIRRRRECESCDRRFTTRERIEETPLRVIKRDGTREDFERRKILMGLLTACQKRAVFPDDLEQIVQTVEEQILETSEREIETGTIGDLVMRELKRIDKVAYVRFASVYKNFESAQDFEEIAQSVNQPARKKRSPRRSGPKTNSPGKLPTKQPAKPPMKQPAADETSASDSGEEASSS